LKEGTQGLDGRLIKGSKKAAERGARRQFGSAEEAHKGRGEGCQTLVELFQGGFSAERIADENDDKVNRVVGPEATASKADLQGDFFKQT
jgi:hypothetical protein